MHYYKRHRTKTMDTKALKSKILDLAIRGRLVAQDTDDGTALDLLQRITSERQAKADAEAQDKGKKPAKIALSHITDEEKPFEIPDNWTWCRVEEYLDVRDGTHESPKYFKTGYPLVTSKNLINGKIDFSSCNFICEDDYRNFDERSHVDNGDILYAMIGSIGKPVIVKKDRDFAIKNVALFKKQYSFTNMKWVFYWLLYIEDFLKKNASGGLQPFISLKMFRSLLLPLPPLAEQKRIVAKIEEAFAVIEQIEEGSRMVKENTSALKARTLSLAMRGALVENHTAEGEEDGAALLRRITHYRAEKQKADCLADCKKRGYDSAKTAAALKKLPSLAPVPVTKAEQPFEIPDNWTWCRVEDLIFPMESAKPTGGYFTYIDVDAIDNKNNVISNPKTIAVDKAPSRATRKLHENDILFSMVRPYLQNIALVTEDYKNAIASTGFYVITLSSLLNRKYFFYNFLSEYVANGLNYFMKGDNSPSINNSHIENFPIPLPPLSVQQRIVAKIEEAFAVIAQIEEGSRLVKENASALKARTLSLAMRGALVENHTAEGEEDGAALLRRITHYRAEKQKADCLADCKKRGYDSAKTAAALKKLPSLAPVPVSKAEQPFEIPDNWTWCRLGDIFEIVTGSTPSKRNFDYYSSSDYPFYKPTDLEQGLNVVNCQEMISEKAFLISRQLPKHSILVTCIGATIGKTGVIQEEGICNQQINALLPNQNVSYQCFYYFLLSNFAQDEIRSNASATTLPILNKNKFDNLLLPLPPLSVQKRIVAKIEEVFAVANVLEKA